jgi:hypothetical protein
VSGEIADRGPLERGAAPIPATRAGDARELDRQKAWRDQAARAMTALRAEEGTAPVNAEDLEIDDDDDGPLGIAEGESGEGVLVPGGAPLPTLRILPRGSAGSASSRRSATSSCPSRSPATSTRRTS